MSETTISLTSLKDDVNTPVYQLVFFTAYLLYSVFSCTYFVFVSWISGGEEKLPRRRPPWQARQCPGKSNSFLTIFHQIKPEKTIGPQEILHFVFYCFGCAGISRTHSVRRCLIEMKCGLNVRNGHHSFVQATAGC